MHATFPSKAMPEPGFAGAVGTAALPPPEPSARVATASGRRVKVLDRFGPYGRPVVALIVIVLAYRVSFQTLLESLTLDTPLAHLALVPFIALGLCVVGARGNSGPPIHDRQLDWIVSVPLMATALSVNYFLPQKLSTEFWVYRLDLLSLPFFVAGVVIMLLGTRMLWRMRVGVLFLFLAWPYPYSQLLDRWMIPFTAVTVKAVTAAVHVVRVAVPTPGGRTNALFTVSHAKEVFNLSVASECSGANGLLGFTLMGLAFLFVSKGSKKAKAVWLVAGASLVWALNVVRILIIFGAGQKWGQKVAIDGFHPVIGLVVFNVGVLVMALLLPRFRLRWPTVARRLRTAADGPLAPAPKSYRPALRAGAVTVALSTIGVGMLNTNLHDYDLVASSLGSPRLVSYETSRETPDGWQSAYYARYDWTKRFFGPDSVWSRYTYNAGNQSPVTLRSNAQVVADVITTSDRAAFSNYGIEACYRFHNFTVSKRQSIDLGGGVVGGLLTWRNPADDSITTTLYWHWPIRNGDKTRWERVTLLLVDNPTLTFSGTGEQASGVVKDFQAKVAKLVDAGPQADPALATRLVSSREFLVGFGEDMVRRRAGTAGDAGTAGAANATRGG